MASWGALAASPGQTATNAGLRTPNTVTSAISVEMPMTIPGTMIET